MPESPANQSVWIPPIPKLPKRDVGTAPFVEIFNGRIQGVVSSDSDIERVYCAFLEIDTGHYYSSTNNNRPDAGMEKRIRYLMEEAIAKYGEAKLTQLIQPKGSLLYPKGNRKPEPASEIFSRFLGYLSAVEAKAAQEPTPEMAWFVG